MLPRKDEGARPVCQMISDAPWPDSARRSTIGLPSGARRLIFPGLEIENPAGLMRKVCSGAARRAAMLLALGGLWVGIAVHCPAAIVEYPIPSTDATPEGITCGPDGAYWFVEFNENNIGRISPTNDVVTEYPIPGPGGNPFDIVTGPDGNLWFTEYSFNGVGRITTNGVIQQFALPFTFNGTGITLGPDGRLWLLDFGGTYGNGVQTNGGVIALAIGTNGVTNAVYFNSTNLTVHSRPVSITRGRDGNLYFTEELTGKIARITTNGVITESGLLPTNSQPFVITTGPDGALWFTFANSNALGRIDTNLNISQFVLPTNNTGGLVADYTIGLTLGRDGNLYYTDPLPNLIGRVQVNETTNATNLTVSQFYTPTTNAFPLRITTGPDRNIWFGEAVDEYSDVGDNIGEFILPVPLTIQLTNNLTNTLVTLSWPTNITTNFMLEANASLSTTNWFFVTNVPVVVTNTNGIDFTVTLPVTNSTNATNANLFFRLID
jgi:virginiamycin B lyase